MGMFVSCEWSSEPPWRLASLGQSRLGHRRLCRRSIIRRLETTMCLGNTRPDEITMRHEITMGRGITMRRNEMTMRRLTITILITMRRRQALGTITVIRHGMDAPRDGRFKVETAHPTRVQLVEGGGRGTAARPITRYKADAVS